MNKKKFRFNAIDVLILLIITAVVFVLLYVFVLRMTAQSSLMWFTKTFNMLSR